jgi:hypothetical protein
VAASRLYRPPRERAIAIIAPLPVKDRDKVNGEETGETHLLFNTMSVFDRSTSVRAISTPLPAWNS